MGAENNPLVEALNNVAHLYVGLPNWEVVDLVEFVTLTWMFFALT